MSSYDSESQGSNQSQKDETYFKVFQHDFYLSASLDLIEDWKLNINQALNQNKQIQPLKYLQLEAPILDKQENHLRAAFHIRYFAFGTQLKKAFKNLVSSYQQIYQQQPFDQNKLHQLDQLATKLTFYMQKIQRSRAVSYIQQIENNNDQVISNIYQSMEKFFPYVQDPYCIWRIVQFLQFRSDQKGSHVMNIPFNMTLEYYLKTFRTLKFKHEKLTEVAVSVNVEIQKGEYFTAYVKAAGQVSRLVELDNQQNNQNPNQVQKPLACQFLCCLRYMHYATCQRFSPQNNLYIQYIFSSLKIPFYGKNETMPTEYFEGLFLKLLKELKQEPRLIDLAMYIDPNVVGQRSQQSFGQLEELVLELCREVAKAQQAFLNTKEQPEKLYLKELLKDQQYTQLVQLIQTIMSFNKSAFLKADQQIYEIFLDMADFLKTAFLSFGKDLWLFPQNIFQPLTLSFFKRISQDINDDLKNMLYQMVQNLNADKLPQKLIFSNGQFSIVNVSRLQYLSAIMYYIQDCSREQQYLNLPQIHPANFQTSTLLIKSLHVKLKHHEPNPAQMPLFTQYLKECQKYKLHINFSWYKQENYLAKSVQRETQFQIESSLPCKQIQQLFRTCLNLRDWEFARKLIRQVYNQNHLITAHELAALLKYNHGMVMEDVDNVREEEIFYLLEEMQTMLAILPNQLFDLPLSQQINVNYLHLLLTFYCSKIQQAKGSEIYFMIFQKILLNYLRTPCKKSQKFMKKYPNFFKTFIYQYHQIEICGTLNQLLSEFQEKYLPFAKDENEWSNEQKQAVKDLKSKIKAMRTQFLDKLQGSQEEISMFMVTFTSLVSDEFPFSIFLQCVRLFVKLILRKPSLKSIVDIEIFLSQQTYSQPQFLTKMINYFNDSSSQNQQGSHSTGIKQQILRHTLKSPAILKIVSFKQLMELLQLAQQHIKDEPYECMQEIYRAMEKVISEKPEDVRPEWILAYILLSRYELQDQGEFGIFQQQTLKKKQQKAAKMQKMLQVMKNFENNKQFWSRVHNNLKDFKFRQFEFLFDFTYQFKDLMRAPKDPPTYQYIWLYFLKHLNNPSWTFYYMLRLNDPSLINIHENRDQMLINLIKKQKLTKQSYPIFKSMISDTKDMPYILGKVMQSYENQQNYVDNFQFHNKLILINQRFPDSKVQESILRWIQVGENKLPLKIPQNYYINFLKKRLKSLPENLAYDSILKVHESPAQLSKLNKEIEKIFEILLYFPVKKFQSVSLVRPVGDKDGVKEEQAQEKQEMEQNEGDWQQQEENQDIEIKKTQGSKQEPPQQQNSASQSESQNQSNHDSQNMNNSQNSDQNNNYYDDRPQILQIFYQQDKKPQFQSYKYLCKLREEIDVYLKSDYQKLVKSPVQDNQYLVTKLLSIMKELGNFETTIQESIVIHMPDPLLQALKTLGYGVTKDKEKLQKLRKPKRKVLKINAEMFSDRGESMGDDSDNDYSSEGYDEGDNDYNDEEDGYDDDNDDDSMSEVNDGGLKIQKKKKANNFSSDQQQIQLPELNTQFSKVQSEIKGNQLQRKQLIKILEVFLVQIFKLTPINFKKKEIVYSYVQIMESDLGQVFFESVLTLLRMDQNPQKNRKTLIEEMKEQLKNQESKFRLQQLSGFAQFSKYNGIVNFTYLLKTLKSKGKYPQDQTNPFRKQSGALLPISQKFIITFDLPIQTNIFSLVLLYIHSKSKIQQLIQEIAVSYQGAQVKLTKKQIKRISEAFLRQKTHSSAWEFIQGTVNYQVKDTQRLIISLDSYSQQAYKALVESGIKLKQTIEKNNQLFNKKIGSQSQINQNQNKPPITHIKHYQRLYYITSNLLSSCSQQIKHFYFMNKQICRYLWEDDDQNQDNYNYNKVPKKLLKCKKEIEENQSFVDLVELAFRVIYFVKKQLYGKISGKKFARLIHYPKLVIQTATMYMHLSGQKGTKTNWNFLPQKQILKVIDQQQIKQKLWTNLSQVYNLILGLLQIQSFSNGKFKQLLIPYFTQHRQIALQAPLMFKVPEINDDVNGQNIYITRECSFDMALYQVQGQGLFVEFHGEEGSDHGGLIREFMMGWKGLGVGEEHFFIGKILGISFRQSVPYGGYVDLQMCIKITNYKLTLQNLQEIDKEIYNSLKFVKENDPTDLGLTFSVMKKNPKSFEPEQFCLKPGGNEIQLTQENKEQYIKLYLQKYYQVGREYQLSQIATGFYTVLSPSYASIFKPHQLMQHIKGQQVCDINVIKSHVKYTQGYTQTSVIIKWLWEILQTYNQEQLNKFIQFLTGSPKLPIFNPNFEITIERVFEVKNLPVAHTCFNTLDLPEYPTKHILEKNLLTAIFEGNDNFSIM